VPEDFNARVIREFQENDGKVGPPFEGAPMILVHHRGAKSGTVRTTPLRYFVDGDRYLIVASKAGAPTNPDWYHNVKANPELAVDVATDEGVEKLTVQAAELTGPERESLWTRIVDEAPGFGDYAEKTNGVRTIPIFGLTRAA
jgi:deazaflavin-dependent oxidoreductase (nitroreductase family)